MIYNEHAVERALGTVVRSGTALGRLQYVRIPVQNLLQNVLCPKALVLLAWPWAENTVEGALWTVVRSGMALSSLQYVQALGRTTVERALGTVVLFGVALGRLQYLPALVAQVLKQAGASEL